MGVERRILVVGGGLAGITAALDCAAAGASVTLVEVRRRLGGAAYSFDREGLEMDNGQHVFLRCCEAYLGLLRRLGSAHLVRVQPRLDIPVLKPGAAPARLRRGSLPAPLHLAGALARYPHLSRAQRLGAARAAIGLMRMGSVPPGRLDGEAPEPTFGEWLARRGQGPEALGALWDLIALPTLNLPASEASLSLAAFVFRTGLLSRADAGDIGFHMATLGETIGSPAERALRRAGVEVRLGWRAERLRSRAGGIEVLGRGQRPGGADETAACVGESPQTGAEPPGAPAEAAGGGSGGRLEGLAGEAAILAVPHMRAATLLEPLLGEAAARLRQLGNSPIVNLHVVFDRPVCEHPFAAGVGTPVQYLFDRTAAAGAPPGSQYLAISISGAEREMRMSVEELRERYLPALRELLPRAREATVEQFMATREHAATFRAAPGVNALRPGGQTAVPGLLLAGAWTDTGWPATLEGAVLSGHSAARAALQALGVAPDGRAAAEQPGPARSPTVASAGAPAP